MARGGGAGAGGPDDPPDCLAVNVRPAADTVPSRAPAPFGPIVRLTDALAVALDPPEIEIHGALLTELQEQPVRVVTENDRVPPAAPIEASTGSIE